MSTNLSIKKWSLWLSMICGLMIFVIAATPLYAQENTYVKDENNHLSASQLDKLAKIAEKIKDENQATTLLVITDTPTDDVEYSAQEYLYNTVGKDGNGAIFYIDLANRNFTTVTSGNMIDFLTDARLEDINDKVTESLKENNFDQAATDYFEMVLEDVKAGIPHHHYRINKDTGEITYIKTLTPLEIGIAIIGGIATCLGIFFTVKGRYQLRIGGRYHYDRQNNGMIDLEINDTDLIDSFITTRVIETHDSDDHDSGGSTFGSGFGGGSFGGGGSRSF